MKQEQQSSSSCSSDEETAGRYPARGRFSAAFGGRQLEAGLTGTFSSITAGLEGRHLAAEFNGRQSAEAAGRHLAAGLDDRYSAAALDGRYSAGFEAGRYPAIAAGRSTAADSTTTLVHLAARDQFRLGFYLKI